MKKTNKNQHLTAVDFFCSAGGMTTGFRKAGITVLGGIDIDASCKETYEINNKGSLFINSDISKFSEEELIQKLRIKKNDDNLIFIGCSPCQYYTNIQTEKNKSKKTRLLIEDFQRFVKYFKPGYIVIENVPGFESKKDSPLQKFKDFLKQNKYVYNDGVINALYYNVPQKRRRYLLIATRVKDKIDLPKPEKNVDHLILKNYIGGENGFVKISAGHYDESNFLHTAAKLRDINLKRIKATPKNGGTRLAWKNNPELQLQCYKGKDETFTDVYGRMFWNHPAPTLTTKFYSISNGRYGHPEEDRGISLREGAILQTFPKNYKFVSKHPTVIARMIGNAVPPQLSMRVATSILICNQNE